MRFIKTVFLFYILSLFTACSGQTQSHKNKSGELTLQDTVTFSKIYKSIWCIYQDTKNNYWYGSNGNGVYKYDGKELTRYTKKEGLTSDKITGIQEDRAGNIFFDSPEGVNKYDGKTIIQLKPINKTGKIWDLNSDDLWFKGNGNKAGAFVYDGNVLYNFSLSDFDPKATNDQYSVYSIYRAKDGDIWLGTLCKGIYRFDGQSLDHMFEKEFATLDDGRVPGVRSIIEDNEGFFWFSNVLHKYKIRNIGSNSLNTIDYEKLPGIAWSPNLNLPGAKLPYYNSAAIDIKTGDIWMSTYDDGVWRYDGEKLHTYYLKEGKVNVLVICLYKDNEGVIWLGTDNAGVYKYNGKEFEKFVF